MTQQNFLRNLTAIIEFTKAKKPEWASPLDILLVIQLLSATGDDGRTNVGIEWLSQSNGACHRTIEASLKRISTKNYGWVSKISGKQTYSTNTYSVQIGNLPLHVETKHSIVSAAATNAAMYYHGLVKALPKIETKNGRKRSIRVAPDWMNHWGYVAQSWLDEGYDADHIKAVIDRAFQTKSWSYCHGLHTLKKDFLKLLRLSGWKVCTENGYLLTVK